MAKTLDDSLALLKQEKVAVLYGGNSAERDVSLKSGQAIAKGLEEAGFTVVLIDTKTVPLTDLLAKKIDQCSLLFMVEVVKMVVCKVLLSI